MCGLMSDLVICKFRESMVIYDTECPYWFQMSLNNTNQTKPSSNLVLAWCLFNWVLYTILVTRVIAMECVMQKEGLINRKVQKKVAFSLQGYTELNHITGLTVILSCALGQMHACQDINAGSHWTFLRSSCPNHDNLIQSDEICSLVELYTNTQSVNSAVSIFVISSGQHRYTNRNQKVNFSAFLYRSVSKDISPRFRIIVELILWYPRGNRKIYIYLEIH